MIANDHYLVAADPERQIELAFSADLTRGVAGGDPWILMEHSTSAVNWQPRNQPKMPGEMLRNSLAHVARGADAVMFFQWRQSFAGSEKFHSAMVPHGGRDTRVWREVVELGAALKRLAPVRGFPGGIPGGHRVRLRGLVGQRNRFQAEPGREIPGPAAGFPPFAVPARHRGGLRAPRRRRSKATTWCWCARSTPSQTPPPPTSLRLRGPAPPSWSATSAGSSTNGTTSGSAATPARSVTCWASGGGIPSAAGRVGRQAQQRARATAPATAGWARSGASTCTCGRFRGRSERRRSRTGRPRSSRRSLNIRSTAFPP